MGKLVANFKKQKKLHQPAFALLWASK